MAIEEDQRAVIEIESESSGSFVSTLASKACFNFGSLHVLDTVLELIFGVEEDVAANHGLLGNAEVLVFLGKRASDDLAP